MNIFSYVLAEDELEKQPRHTPTKFVVDDNIGESIHIHYRNMRLEFSVEEFETFAEQIELASENFDDETKQTENEVPNPSQVS